MSYRKYILATPCENDDTANGLSLIVKNILGDQGEGDCIYLRLKECKCRNIFNFFGVLFPYYSQYFKFYRNLHSLMIKNTDAVIVLHTHLLGLYTLFLKRRIVVYYKTDSLIRLYKNEKHTGWRGLLNRIRLYSECIFVKFCDSRADVVVYVTEADRIEDARFNNRSSLVVIPNGVDSDAINLRTSDAYIESSNKIKCSLIFHGDLAYLPNKEAVVEYEGVASSGSCFPILNVFGKPGGLDWSNLDNICYRGYAEKIDDVFASSGVYLALIRSGAGMKNKILEAMASGLEIICTEEALIGIRVPSELIFIVSSESDIQLSYQINQCLIKISSMSEQSLVVRASQRRLYSEKHSWLTARQSFLKIVNNI